MLSPRLSLTLCTLLLFVTVANAAPEAPVPSGACNSPITISAKDDGPLREAFNRARGKVRLVFLVDPICPGCLRGLKDLDTAVLAPHAKDAQLQTFVIHTPVLGADATDSANTCALVHNEHVTHYWDPQQELGTVFGDVLGMKNGDKTIYAWDVWLVYGPDAEWKAAAPPKADFLMHQLKALMGREGFPFLNAPIFSAEVDKQLQVAAHATPTTLKP